MNNLEFTILSNKYMLQFTNILFKYYHFNEIFLIKSRPYYNSINCLRTQKNLSLLFCFEYLYDSQYDENTSKCYIDDIIKYYRYKYSKKFIISYYKHLIQNNYI
jgi:hypothetical protein